MRFVVVMVMIMMVIDCALNFLVALGHVDQAEGHMIQEEDMEVGIADIIEADLDDGQTIALS